MRTKLTLLLLFFSCRLLAQTADTIHYEKNPINFVVSPGISYQKKFLGELNFYFAKTGDDVCNGCYIGGPRLGVETNFDKSNFIIAPKIGYELSGIIICMRGNAVCYFNESQKDLRLLPEIGITVGCIVNITYGYGFSILDDKISGISNSRVTLTVNLVRDWWGF